MKLEEYFGNWIRVIDKKELFILLSKLEIEYKRKSICPIQKHVFKAFKLCSYEDLRVVMLGQDFSNKL